MTLSLDYATLSDVGRVRRQDRAVKVGSLLPLGLESECDGLLGTLALETRGLFPRCGRIHIDTSYWIATKVT